MSNFKEFVERVNGVIEEVGDVKDKLQAIYALKDALFDEMDEKFIFVHDKVKLIKDEVMGLVDGKLFEFKEQLMADQDGLRKELFEALDVLKGEVSGMSIDFGFKEKEVVPKSELEGILEALKLESPDNFMNRSYVIEYMAEQLKGKALEGESWYVLYKTIRNR